MDRKEAAKLVLENTMVKLEPIIRRKPFFKEGHDGEFMFSGCEKVYYLPFQMSTNSYVRIFQTTEEQEAFEVLLDLPKGALNIYDRNNEYWTKKFKVAMSKEGKPLDLSIPSHALEYRILLANKTRIAPDWETRNKPGYEYAIVNESQKEEDSYKLSEKREEAMSFHLKMKKDPVKMYNTLRVLGLQFDKNSINNTRFLSNKLMEVINQTEKIRGTNSANIDDYLAVVSDKDFSNKVFIYDAVDKGEISIKNNVFRVTSTGEVIGSNIEQAVLWLNSDKNQETKILLKQRLS